MIPRTPNRLQHEKSPYLLQHAENPVDWYPWGEEAFARAKQEDKPVFLSIGYSTCHWCHVMAHESFEDEEVAALLNEAFVCIKVDREERPDIDEIYMRVCQMMTGSGGWPLTIVMTPDKRPFFAATYIPKEDRWGRTGLVALIPRIGGGLEDASANEIEKAAAGDRIAPAQPVSGPRRAIPGEETPLRGLCRASGRSYDAKWRVRPRPEVPDAPSAPLSPPPRERTGDKEASGWRRNPPGDAPGRDLRSLGFGFHRYSTDRQWLVPHFEKMLYDQALCALAYTEAFQATGDRGVARTAREIIAYVPARSAGAGRGILRRRGCRQRGRRGEVLPLADGRGPGSSVRRRRA